MSTAHGCQKVSLGAGATAKHKLSWGMGVKWTEDALKCLKTLFVCLPAFDHETHGNTNKTVWLVNKDQCFFDLFFIFWWNSSTKR